MSASKDTPANEPPKLPDCSHFGFDPKSNWWEIKIPEPFRFAKIYKKHYGGMECGSTRNPAIAKTCDEQWADYIGTVRGYILEDSQIREHVEWSQKRRTLKSDEEKWNGGWDGDELGLHGKWNSSQNRGSFNALTLSLLSKPSAVIFVMFSEMLLDEVPARYEELKQYSTKVAGMAGADTATYWDKDPRDASRFADILDLFEDEDPFELGEQAGSPGRVTVDEMGPTSAPSARKWKGPVAKLWKCTEEELRDGQPYEG